MAVKRQIALSKPKKVNVGHQCPICEMPFPKGQNRDHVVSHFTDEIKELIMTFPDQRACLFCEYTCERTENLIKHLGEYCTSHFPSASLQTQLTRLSFIS